MNEDLKNIEVHNNSIDVLKGLLILAVIVGHMLLGTLNESLPRMLIYAFHMPVFFFISGWLINVRKILELSIGGLLKKYSLRMLIQWFIALCVFTVLTNYPNISWKVLGYSLLNPYYHLWFVPTLFIMILLLWIVGKIIRGWQMLFLLLVISVFFIPVQPYISSISCAIRLRFMLWFVIGLICKKITCELLSLFPIKWLWIGGILFNLIILIPLHYLHVEPWRIYEKYFMIPYCLYICLLLVPSCINKNNLKSRTFEFIGKHSLEIYLWHMVPVFFLKKYFIDNLNVYYGINFSIILLFLLVVYFLLSKRVKNKVY